MINNQKLMLIINILLFCVLLLAGTINNPDTEGLLSKINDGNGKRKQALFIYGDDGIMFYIDIVNNVMRMKNKDGVVNEYIPKENIKTAKRNDRNRIYFIEPIVKSVTQVKCIENNMILFHLFQSERYVQFISPQFKVVKNWADNLVCAHNEFPAAVALIGNIIYTTGENGEIIAYDHEGKIMKRFVIKGLWNESRKFIPAPLSERDRIIMSHNLKSIEENMDIRSTIATRELSERDKLLPNPIFIRGDALPCSIKSIEPNNNGNLVILEMETHSDKFKDKTLPLQRLFELNPETAEILVLEIPGFTLAKANMGTPEKELTKAKENPKGINLWNDENIVDIRCKKDNLYILTRYRMLHVVFKPELKIVGEAQLPYSCQAYNGIPWDVFPDDPPKFLLVNYETRSVDEFPVTADGVGKPLDCGVAEEKKKAAEANKVYIELLDEIDRRHQSEVPIEPVAAEDAAAVKARYAEFFEKAGVKRDFAACGLSLDQDFISTDKKMHKADYLRALPADFKGEKPVLTKLEFECKGIFYVKQDKGMIKAQYDIRINESDGKEHVMTRKLRFIRRGGEWLIYEMD